MSKNQLYPINSGVLKIKTPLGDVAFNCEFSGKSVCNIKPSKIEAASQDVILFSWCFENSIVEFLKLNFKPKLPSNLRVDDCICGLWRIKAFKAINETCCFSCKLNTDYEGSPESGEGLECQSFEDKDFKLSIGTEDHDYLCQRAASHNWLPARFQSDIREIGVEYFAKGIRVILPNLFQGETAQIQFIVAWSSKKNPEVSTWYAVEQSPKKLLHEAGIS